MNCIRFRSPIMLLRQLINRVHVGNPWNNVDKVSVTNPLSLVQNVRTYCSEEKEIPRGDYELQDPKSEEEVVNVVYVKSDGSRVSVRGKVGDSVLFLAHRYNIDLEGACGGALACSTCHCYIQPEYFSKLIPSEQNEEDLLDTAVYLSENSRLGCQLKLTKDLEGMTIMVPSATRNFYVDGYVPKPH